MRHPKRVLGPPASATEPATGSAVIFFITVFALSLPFYVLGATGARLPSLPILPVSALMTFVPMAAASILVYRQRGLASVIALLKRAADMRALRQPGWVLAALMFMPLVCILEFGVLRMTGTAVPLPVIEPGNALLLFGAFFIGAIGEEVGWQGYAYPALRVRFGTLRSAVALGGVWALWHAIPFVQLNRSPDWILWHSFAAVALRIIIVWLFESMGKSVFIAVTFHTMINLSWALFPNSGSYYDPSVSFAILWLAVLPIIAIKSCDGLLRSTNGDA